jgi:hypothetical protein
VRCVLVLGIVLLAGVLPGVASAHVGRTLPVATNFLARITSPVPPLDAKVVDGDQTLWLRAPAATTVSIPGTLGEPLLRFDRGGVWLNLRSPTAQVDRIDRLDLRPSPTGTPPLWHRLTGGHAYAWHEHRLHALEPLARGRSSAGTLGPWSVPVVAGGRRLAVDGVLAYRPPGPSWLRIALTAVLAAAGVAAAARSTAALVGLALVTTVAVWTIRIGRELYGRPGVPAIGYVEIAITCAVGAALVYGLVQRDQGTRLLTAFFAGFGALYEGLTMLPVLTHAIALSALPTVVARTAEVLALGGGIAVVAGVVLGQLNAATEAETGSAGVAG